MSRNTNKYPPKQTSESDKILKEWVHVSESHLGPTEILCDNLEKVNRLIENSMQDIGNEFISIATKFQAQHATIKELSQKPDSDITAEDLKALSKEMDEMESAIGKVIVSMQFQDRVSQNIVITNKVMNFIIEYIKDTENKTVEHLNGQGDNIGIDKEFVSKILSVLTLGDLRSNFTQYLMSQGYIDECSEVGYIHPDDIDQVVEEKDEGFDLF